MRSRLALPLVLIVLVIAESCQEAPDSTPSSATDGPGPPLTLERSEAEAARVAEAMSTVREHWDSEVITGAMVDEIKKVLDRGPADDLAPLLDRIDLLDKSGAAYAPDFALWWAERGRNELGDGLFWRRDLLRDAINVAFDENDEFEAMRLIHEAAATGDPVAKMWKSFTNAEMGGRHDAAALGEIMSLVDEARALADDGDPEAALLLGMIAADGDRDLTNATPEDVIRWLNTAADAGYSHARQRLADMGPLEMRRSVPAGSREPRNVEVASAEDDPRYAAAQLRASSQNNLKQLGLVAKMYANESRGELWPPLSSERGQLAMEPTAIYPEYLTDPNICISPAHPDRSALSEAAANDPQSVIRDHSYWYLGYAVNDEETGLALVNRLRSAYEADERPSDDFAAPEVDLKTIYILREGIERFFITDINDPRASADAQSDIPIMIERPGMHDIGANVLYFDGHVEFLRYPGDFPMSEAFINALKSLDDLKPMPTGGAFLPQ